MFGPFTGNDVVDLTLPARAEHFSDAGRRECRVPRFLTRHLTRAEQLELEDPARTPDVYIGFWLRFAAKEAAYKAFTQAKILTPNGAYPWLQVVLEEHFVVHLPTGSRAKLVQLSSDHDKVHAVVSLGEGDLRWAVASTQASADASAAVREQVIAELADRRSEPVSRFAVTDHEGIPRILYRGEVLAMSVSLSHSGSFMAYSFAEAR